MSKGVLHFLQRENQYYPTPAKLIGEILDEYRYRNNIFEFGDLEEINFLEPCAGDGAICREVQAYFKEREMKINIECLEVEKILRDGLKGQGFKVVGENFEEFTSHPFYNLIIMNPPFSKGDEFLLRAYNLLKADGRLICILNAETIRNPCNKGRELLTGLIKRTDGDVQYIKDAFKDANRKSGVEIAVVYLKKPTYENEFDAFGEIQSSIMTDEEKLIDEIKQKIEGNQIMRADKIDNAMGLYRNAVKQIFQGINTIQQIKTGLSYLNDEAKEFNLKIEDFIKIMLKNNSEEAKEETIKGIRKMAWSYVLKFCNMDGYLFHKQRKEFYTQLDKFSASLPFTKSSILQFFDNLFQKRNEYFKEGIIDLFEEITSRHNGNPYHQEGWKTNKNWKINKKIIVDWGVEFNCYRTNSGRFHSRRYEKDFIDDLDVIVRKIKNYGSQGNTIKSALDMRFNQLGEIHKGQKFYNEVETPYFQVKFYKKGTLHIIFKDDEILKELNFIGAKMRTDLGYDDYGKKQF